MATYDLMSAIALATGIEFNENYTAVRITGQVGEVFRVEFTGKIIVGAVRIYSNIASLKDKAKEKGSDVHQD